jgi:hypothetical protein
MATNPSKDVVRQPDPRGIGDMSAPQDLMNQSWDPTFRTFVSQIVGSSDGTNMYKLKVNPDGSTASAGLITSSYDYIGITYPDAVTEVYVFKTGGSSGTTVGTLTLVYTDSTKANLSSVTKT